MSSEVVSVVRRVIVVGASGMVGKSALREVLADADVEVVLVVGRSSCGETHPKLRELLVPDLFAIESFEHELVGYDACIWAIGVSSAGMNEADYARITETLTMTWARALLRLSPHSSFTYCSAGGAGGPGMWARVRRRVEDALRALPFRHVGVVRPGFIRAGPGISSRTLAYQVGVVLMKPINPLFPLLIRVMPWLFTTSEILGTAMLRIIQGRASPYILESRDINRVGR